MGPSEQARRQAEAGTESAQARLAMPLTWLAVWLLRAGALAALLVPPALLAWVLLP